MVFCCNAILYCVCIVEVLTCEDLRFGVAAETLRWQWVGCMGELTSIRYKAGEIIFVINPTDAVR